MAAGDVYATHIELAAYIASVNNEASIGIDNRVVELTSACAAASRAIDGQCRRVFWKEASPTARVFAARHTDKLWLDDIAEASGVVVAVDTDGSGTYDDTWTSADFQLSPLNGVVNGEPGWPFTKIEPLGSKSFPRDCDGRARVQVTASWGWAAVPSQVKQACLIWAHRIYRRAASPEGVAGFNEFGAVRVASNDSDVDDLLAPYTRRLVGFA